jgi:osmotically-inducible protein OsmY
MFQKTKIATLLILSLALPGCMATAIVGGGAATGSAANDKRSVGTHLDDMVLAGKIRGRMALEEDLPSRWVSVEVIESKVILTGYLPRKDQIDRAIQICKSFPRVRDVKSEIKLGKPETESLVSDTWITTKVKAKLLDDPITSGFSIHVETVDGKVYLQGLVASNVERHRAKDLAYSTKGVASVVDMMRVSKE